MSNTISIYQLSLFDPNKKVDTTNKTKKCCKCKAHKTIDNFYKENRSNDRFGNLCKACCHIRSTSKSRRMYDEIHKEHHKIKRIEREFGITFEEYTAKLEEQGCLCAICGVKLTSEKHSLIPSIDHDHQTGKNRGILCGSCNRGLGHFRDSSEMIEKAIEYLEMTDGNLQKM